MDRLFNFLFGGLIAGTNNSQAAARRGAVSSSADEEEAFYIGFQVTKRVFDNFKGPLDSVNKNLYSTLCVLMHGIDLNAVANEFLPMSAKWVIAQKDFPNCKLGDFASKCLTDAEISETVDCVLESMPHLTQAATQENLRLAREFMKAVLKEIRYAACGPSPGNQGVNKTLILSYLEGMREFFCSFGEDVDQAQKVVNFDIYKKYTPDGLMRSLPPPGEITKKRKGKGLVVRRNKSAASPRTPRGGRTRKRAPPPEDDESFVNFPTTLNNNYLLLLVLVILVFFYVRNRGQ